MGSRTKPPSAMKAEVNTEQGRSPALHALYDLADVAAALGTGQGQSFAGDPIEEGGVVTRHAVLQSLLVAGEGGRWRMLADGTAGAVEQVHALKLRAPHMHAVIDVVVRRLSAALVIGVPVALPPLLLLGPPGIGKTWLMARLAEALGVPFRVFGMNLVTLGDTLSGSHPAWKASAPGLVAKTLLRETLANPLILVDELDKPPSHHIGGDLYRPFYSLLEPESARAFTDDHLGIPIDASRILWVAAANRIDEIPAPIIDRLTMIEVGAMAHEDRVAVLGSVYADLRRHYRDFFDPVPALDLLERLVSLPPRRARLALDDAMARAAADGRRSVSRSDVAGRDAIPSPRSAARRVH